MQNIIKSIITITFDIVNDFYHFASPPSIIFFFFFYATLFTGSSPGAQDVVKSRNVGMQNSITISNLSLSNGMTYFATVKGTINIPPHNSNLTFSKAFDNQFQIYKNEHSRYKLFFSSI